MQRNRPDRGIALVSVISVLVLLMIVATPFLLTMRDSARRGERYLHSERVEAEAESLFERAQAHLTTGLEHIERQRLDSLGQAAGAQGTMRPPEDATPTSDTLAELQLPADVLREFNQLSGKEHRIWGLEIVDAQSKFNLNSASVGVFANLLGRATLTDDLQTGDDRVPVDDASAFPPTDGVVRIGSEVIRYATADRNSNTLVGCTRGYMADKGGNGPAMEHKKDATVINEAAFQIASRPFRARPGSWVRYTNVYEARAISDMGVASLRPEEFDRIRPYVTAWNGDVVGDGWSNPQLVRNGITSGGQSELYAEIKNVRYFGPGTVVRITDGVNDDYAVVTEVQGTNHVVLAGDIRHDYPADQTRIYTHSRAAINPNTSDVGTLALVFEGLGMRGKSSVVSRSSALALAQYLKSWQNPNVTEGQAPEVGIFRGWRDFVTALENARDAGNLINADDFEAILRNALNANDADLVFSTVPFTFRSFDVYEARATAAILGTQGDELARREMRRVFEVASARSSTFVLETQAEFQDQIRVSRDAKWFVTYPNNINAYYDGVNEPASEYLAYATKQRFPDTDRSPSVGHLQLRLGAPRLTGTRNDRTVHFDEEESPEGLDLETSDFQMGVDGPYSTTDRKADLVRFVDIPQSADEVELGLAPFSCSFWYKPAWSLDNTEHVIFDYGLSETFMNRVSLRYDPERRALVLGVADATREQRACEVEYSFDDQQLTWEADQWYHIACTVYGCSPEMMELFVDAEQAGRTPLQTRLTNTIPPTGDIQSVDVEDASGFPDTGVLILRGPEGVELIEYVQKTSGDRGFQVRRRKARSQVAQLDSNLETSLSHAPGEIVQLYGFAAPLLSDIRRGGATLTSAIGPFRVFRAIGTDTANYQTPPTTGGGAPGNVTLPPGIALIQGYQNEITLTEWTTGNPGDNATLDDLGPNGTEGIAALVGPTFTLDALNDTVNVAAGTGGASGTNTDIIGGMDIVHYRVGTTDSAGLKVTFLTRGLVLRHWDSSVWVTQAPNGGRFFPSYDYGTTGSPYQIAINGQNLPYPGTYTAFVPIALVGSGGSADYLDPADQEDQLGSTNSQGIYTPGFAYVQVDSEWFKYDTFDNTILPGKVAFYRDLRLPNLASLMGFGSGTPLSPIVQPSAGRGGGSGGGSSNTEPPLAIDGNDEAVAPPAPSTGGGSTTLQPPPANVEMVDIAAALDFRSFEDRNTLQLWRIANTIARDHSSGTQIVPCFRIVPGNDWDVTPMGRRGYGGFNDLITLRDTRGADEQIRIQWGFGDWMAPTQPTLQTWQWDRPQDLSYLRSYPSQAWTRALKFPSAEMPDQQLTQNVEAIRWGKRFDDAGGETFGTLDEVAFQELEFPADDRRDWVYLGEVPAQLYTTQNAGTTQQPLRFGGLDETADEIPVFMPWYDQASRVLTVQGLPIPDEVFRADGGIVRIDEELILYSEFDAGAGVLRGCIRGRFGTPARPHQYGAIVFPVESFACSRLTSGADETTASFEVMDASDFPDDGYLRIDDGLELIGYTELEGNRLSGPLGRIDPTDVPRGVTDPAAAEKRVGGGIFRGRFGTEATAYEQGAIVLAMPWRHYDRYAERSDDPENSYAQFSWTRENAVWKRVTWEELPVKNVQVLALVRFSGGPEWDADRIVRVGQETLPKDDRRGWLYEITDPKAENLINVEADRIEVRLMVRFAKGAYDRDAKPRPNEWKQTPWLKKVVVEYVAPTSVLSQE